MKTRMLVGMLAIVARAAAGGECTPIELNVARAAVVWRANNVVRVLAGGDDVVFVETKETLQRIAARDGNVAWTYCFEEEIAPRLVVLPNRIAIARNDHYVAFLDRETGSEISRTD